MTLLNTHELVIRTIAEGCGHETYRALAERAEVAPSTVLRAAQELERQGRLVRCSCGHGWVISAAEATDMLTAAVRGMPPEGHTFESQPSSG